MIYLNQKILNGFKLINLIQLNKRIRGSGQKIGEYLSGSKPLANQKTLSIMNWTPIVLIYLQKAEHNSAKGW